MILRRVARPLLASIFISGGIAALRHKEGHAEAAKPLIEKATEKASGTKAGEVTQSLPTTDPVTFVQVDAAVKLTAGTMLSFGIMPRVAATMLLGSLVPTTLAAHSFWEEKDPQQRQQQMTEFIKNLSLGGGLLLAVADTGGKPSLGWRARHVAEEASHQVQGTAGAVQRKAGTAATKASKATTKASKATTKAGMATGKAKGVGKGVGKGKAAKTLASAGKPAAKSLKGGTKASKRSAKSGPMPALSR